MSKGTHKTKDGRTAKKGLYYNMNKRKKAGTSRPGKGTVTDSALKRSAKTAKKKKGGELGKLSMIAGQDSNPNVTRADIIAGATMGEKKKEMKKGGKKKMYGGMAKKKKMYGGKMKKGMGGKKMMYETGGFLEPGIPNLDDCCN